MEEQKAEREDERLREKQKLETLKKRMNKVGSGENEESKITPSE